MLRKSRIALLVAACIAVAQCGGQSSGVVGTYSLDQADIAQQIRDLRSKQPGLDASAVLLDDSLIGSTLAQVPDSEIDRISSLWEGELIVERAPEVFIFRLNLGGVTGSTRRLRGVLYKRAGIRLHVQQENLELLEDYFWIDCVTVKDGISVPLGSVNLVFRKR